MLTLIFVVLGAIHQEKLAGFELVEVSWLSHDVNLYKFKVEDKKMLNVPIGHHISIVYVPRPFHPTPASLHFCDPPTWDGLGQI